MSKENKGLQLVSTFQLPMPFIVTTIEISLHKALGVGKPFQEGRAYIVMAAGTTASGNIYILILNDHSEFVWVPQEACTVANMQPQQRVPLVLAGKLPA